MSIKITDERLENGRFRAMSVDNTGADERPTFGTLRIRKNRLHLASSKEDFTVQDTIAGRKQAAEALEKGFLVYDLADNLLNAEDLTEKK